MEEKIWRREMDTYFNEVVKHAGMLLIVIKLAMGSNLDTFRLTIIIKDKSFGMSRIAQEDPLLNIIFKTLLSNASRSYPNSATKNWKVSKIFLFTSS